MMSFKIRAWTFAAVIAAASGYLSALAWAAVAPDQLYQALLKTALTNVPSGRSTEISDLPVRSDAASMGLVGSVRITIQGGPARTRITYYVFTNPFSAAGYNMRFLAVPPRSGIRLAHPPLTQCDETATGGGYCNLVVQENSVVITTESSAPMDSVTGPLMAIAVDHLNKTVSAAPQSPPRP